MSINFSHVIYIVILAFSLASCATTDKLTDDLNFDYSKAETSVFNGYWEGRTNCKNQAGGNALPWIKVSDGKGEFGFGQGKRIGWKSSSIYSAFDTQNGKVNFNGHIKPWGGAKKTAVSFSGLWQDKTFKISGQIGKRPCSGVLSKN